MGIFDFIKYGQIKSFTKGACRSMLLAFGEAEAEAKEGKIEAKLYSDLAAKALSNRPRWKEIEKNTFQHSSGEKLKIKKDDNLANVALNVILIEMDEFIFNDEQPEKILTLIVEEFRNFFKVSDEFLQNHGLLSRFTNQITGAYYSNKFKKGDFGF